ncbi:MULTISPECIES: cation acetate symporter [unclassified Streptomyces]|uniref:sodium/solute symporter n=1 Tax=unclassified Streptomyces TaxID=2593676 RepID=UPI0035D883CC
MRAVGHETTTVVGFLIFMVLCGFLCVLANSEDEAEDWSVRHGLKPWQQGLAISGTGMSSVSLMAITGMVAVTGHDGVMLLLGMVMSMVLLALVLAEPLRRTGGRTVGDALARRMPRRSVRAALALVTLTVCLCFLVLQLAAVGAMTAHLLGLSGAGPKTACIVTVGALMVSLAVTGGLRGTALVQIVKVGVLLVVYTALALVVLHRFGWNPDRLLATAVEGSGLGDAYLGTGGQYGSDALGVLEQIGTAIVLPLGISCLPQVTMRVLGVRRADETRRVMRWAVGQMLLISMLLVVVGFGAAAVVGGRGLAGADPAAGAVLSLAGALDRDGLLLSAVACAVFLAALATVADVVLAGARTVAQDLYTQTVRRGGLSPEKVSTSARWTAPAIGTVAVVLAVLAGDWPLLVLSTVAATLSASALAPVLLYSLLWRRFTKTGALWCLYGSTLLTLGLTAVSPLISGSPGAVFPDMDFQLTSLTVPGVVTVPAGFALGWLGSVLSRPGPHHEPDVARETPFAPTGDPS